MIGGDIRLRERRAIRAKRSGGRWQLPTLGAVFAILIGAACWAPTVLAPTALAPTEPVDSSAPGVPAVEAGAAPVMSVAAAVLPAPIVAQPTAVPARPVAVPTPYVMPTLSPAGQAMLDGIRSDRTAQWVKNHTETPLHSGPSDDSQVFTRLPQWTLLKQIGSQPDWRMVQYSGDGDTRQPGPGWVKASDVGSVDAPTIWLKSAAGGSLWSAPDASGKHLVDVPRGVLLELLGSPGDPIQGTRVHVRSPGDGRSVPPSEGWVDGNSIARAASPALDELPWAYPEDLHAAVRISVPYRTQLDGSDYATANCGPTVLGMALETFGVNMPPPDLRAQVLDTENFQPDDTDAGSFIWALADVAADHGVRTTGLYDEDGSLHHWTPDEIRSSLLAGHPVIVQVVYRALPGRSESGYYGDHYIIITGLVGDSFLYNDPIGGTSANEGPGYDRLMTPTQLQHAMHASDSQYAFSAFSLSR